MKKNKMIWLRNILRAWLGIKENTEDIEYENSKINELTIKVNNLENQLKGIKW